MIKVLCEIGASRFRKIMIPLFILSVILINNDSSLYAVKVKENSNSPCTFCDPSVIDYQKFYEDDLVVALYTHKPIFPGHSLIIPKRHVERFEMLSTEEILRIGEAIKKVNLAAEKVFNTSSYLLLQKNGAEVGQSLAHLHIHYVPRKEGDRSILKYFYRMLLANIKHPISAKDMRSSVKKMKNAIE